MLIYCVRAAEYIPTIFTFLFFLRPFFRQPSKVRRKFIPIEIACGAGAQTKIGKSYLRFFSSTRVCTFFLCACALTLRDVSCVRCWLQLDINNTIVMDRCLRSTCYKTTPEVRGKNCLHLFIIARHSAARTDVKCSSATKKNDCKRSSCGRVLRLPIFQRRS